MHNKEIKREREREREKKERGREKGIGQNDDNLHTKPHKIKWSKLGSLRILMISVYDNFDGLILKII